MAGMDLTSLIRQAASQGASDIHLEPGLPATLRVRGALVPSGDRCTPQALARLARELIESENWAAFEQRRSADISRVIAGMRCRINLLHGTRGIGLAVRLLSNRLVTLRNLNLLPELEQLMEHKHGIILVCGPTGCGKTSTLAALLNHLNATEARHIVTVEQPVEYVLEPDKCFIRQREVGRDTPDFEQALIDSMREDIDVLMVGEMQTRETMRLTLDVSETGHLVLATIHASTVTEALQRIVSAFPALEQPSVCAQLANGLVAVVSQRLQYRDELDIRVPECEVLMGSTATRAIIRQGQLFKLATVLETGGQDGMWTLDRYRAWLDRRTDWVIPDDIRQEALPLDLGASEGAPLDAGVAPDTEVDDDDDDVIVINPEDASLTDLLSDLDDR